jgi:fructose-specific phosphotransferase system component IIB
MDARTHMLREAAKLERAGEEHGWTVKVNENSNGHAGIETVLVVDCVATRGQETISIWWENKRLLEAPKYTLAGNQTKLRNASACVQQMAKRPDFEKAARKTRTKKRSGEVSQDIERERMPWEDLPDGYVDADILRMCYAKTIVYKNGVTGEVLTEVVVRSSDASLRKGNFNSRTYHISRSSEGREILNFLGVFGFRSIALDSILRVGTSEEAAERTRKHLLEIVAEDDKTRDKEYRKVAKKLA